MPRPSTARPKSPDQTLAAFIRSLAKLPLAEFKTHWRQHFEEPFSRHRPVLLPCLAYHLQAQQYGGLPKDLRRQLDSVADDLSAGRQPRFLGPPRIRPGTRLIRSWRGEVHEVTVLDKGYLYREKEYPSLSEIAQTITGAKWSGPRFFGLHSPSIKAQLQGDA